MSERARERGSGIRSALGARPRVLVSSVMRDGLKPIVAGFVGAMILVPLLWEAVAAMVYQAKPDEGDGHRVSGGYAARNGDGGGQGWGVMAMT